MTRLLSTLAATVAGILVLALGAGGALAGSQSPGATGTPAADTLAAIKKRGVLNVGVGLYSPQSAQTPGGKLTGIDIDIINRYARSLGVKVKYTVVGYDIIVAGLQTGKWDMTTALITSAERKKVAAFSSPTYTVDQIYFVRADSPHRTLADLNKSSVTIINVVGSYDEEVRKKYLPNSTSRAVAGMSQAQYIAEVISGRADAANVETPFTTLRMQKQFGNQIRFIPDVFKGAKALETSPVAYALPKGDPKFKRSMNTFLAKLRKAGTIDKIFKKYTNSLLGPIKD